MAKKTKAQRLVGTAAMTAKKRREVAAAGGRAAHAKGVAHTFSKREAKKFGALGGRKMHENARKGKYGQSTATTKTITKGRG